MEKRGGRLIVAAEEPKRGARKEDEGVWSNKSREYDMEHSLGSMDGE